MFYAGCFKGVNHRVEMVVSINPRLASVGCAKMLRQRNGAFAPKQVALDHFLVYPHAANV